MNPWVTGRIIEQMQAEARESARQAHVHRAVVEDRRRAATETSAREPWRERLGLAVARVGLRIAGRPADPAVGRGAFASAPRTTH